MKIYVAAVDALSKKERQDETQFITKNLKIHLVFIGDNFFTNLFKSFLVLEVGKLATKKKHCPKPKSAPSTGKQVMTPLCINHNYLVILPTSYFHLP